MLNSMNTDPGSQAEYPARLDASLDDPLSRRLCLVKWLLVVPHVVVLIFLWIATTVLTIVAGVWILLPGPAPTL